MNYEHAHDAMMRIFFRENRSKGNDNAGVNVFLSLVKDIRKETEFYRSERHRSFAKLTMSRRQFGKQSVTN
jgi:hypothetical protein